MDCSLLFPGEWLGLVVELVRQLLAGLLPPESAVAVVDLATPEGLEFSACQRHPSENQLPARVEIGFIRYGLICLCGVPGLGLAPVAKSYSGGRFIPVLQSPNSDRPPGFQSGACF